jgi:hypothetical protein
MDKTQYCQMFQYFQTKNTNLDKFWRVLNWKILLFLQPFGIFCGHMVYLVVIWYIFPILVCCTKQNLSTLIKNTNHLIYFCAITYACDFQHFFPTFYVRVFTRNPCLGQLWNGSASDKFTLSDHWCYIVHDVIFQNAKITLDTFWLHSDSPSRC